MINFAVRLSAAASNSLLSEAQTYIHIQHLRLGCKRLNVNSHAEHEKEVQS